METKTGKTKDEKRETVMGMLKETEKEDCKWDVMNLIRSGSC
jgi:hypothetical protein